MRKGLVSITAAALAAAAGLWVYSAPTNAPSADKPGPALRYVAQVQSDNADPTINLRLTPTRGRWREAQNDNLLYSLPGPLQATVRCIAPDDNVDLPPSQGGNWYYVTALSGPYPDVSGFVAGFLVKDPEPVPECTGELLEHDPYLPGELALAQGDPAEESGFWYRIRLSGFHPSFKYTVGCFDDFDAWGLNAKPAAFRTFDIQTDVSGAWSGDKSCRSGQGTAHWVEIGPYQSERVEWKAPPSTRSVTPTAGPTATPPIPSMTPTAGPTEPPSSSPVSTKVPPNRRIVVQNQVTNGATAMREDTPAYLSSRAAPFCKRDECAVPGTDMNTGATLTASCWTSGPRMTNGQDGNAVDDQNPGLVVSGLWFFASDEAGRSGYISEVYISRAGRGRAGLPSC